MLHWFLIKNSIHVFSIWKNSQKKVLLESNKRKKHTIMNWIGKYELKGSFSIPVFENKLYICLTGKARVIAPEKKKQNRYMIFVSNNYLLNLYLVRNCFLIRIKGEYSFYCIYAANFDSLNKVMRNFSVKGVKQ